MLRAVFILILFIIPGGWVMLSLLSLRRKKLCLKKQNVLVAEKNCLLCLNQSIRVKRRKKNGLLYANLA